jgi:hypothetical protein
MIGNHNEHLTALAALGVWEVVWAGIELLVAEMRERLGSQLRDGMLSVRRLPSNGEREAGELTIGRTRLRLECPLRCAPAGGSELPLHEAFGAATPLARILVLRAPAPGEPPRLESMLVADPATATWISTEPELGPASLRDLGTLEIFFWSLIADRSDSSRETKRHTR